MIGCKVLWENTAGHLTHTWACVGKLPNRRALRLGDSLRMGARERQGEGPQWKNSVCRSKNLAHRLNEGRSLVLEQRGR